MREIKFRAWDTENKKWLKDWSSYKAGGSEQYFVGFNGDLGCYRTIVGLPMPNFDIYDEPDGIIIEQYTGLKDKNGKEIYEGDIIHRGRLPKVNVFRNSVISFDKESVGFIATSTRKGARTIFNGWTCDEIEVIGNIHENQELLERKDAKN